MNRGMVKYIVGRILVVVAILMIPSLFVALIYREGWEGIKPFIISILITGGIGLIMGYKRPQRTDYYAKEGFVIVSLAWLLLSFFGSLPFLLSGSILHPIDAFFETASGFTTTGSSILTDVEVLSHSILWWRSFTHWIGGMGVLVLAIAVMPAIASEDVYIMKAEVPGPVFGKVRAKLASSARILYEIYFVMTVVLIILLVVGGMPVFDSFLHAFGTAGTGGFGIKNTSIGHYDSTYIDYVLGIGMIMFGINFNLYYALLFHKASDFFHSEELKWYLGIIAAAVIAICIDVSGYYDSVSRLIRDVFFTVSSIITTTGYATVNFDTWPVFSRTVLLLLMFCGAMAGSTAGGIKTGRVIIYLKSTFMEIYRSISPNGRKKLSFEGKILTPSQQQQTSFYLTAYLLVFIFLILVVSISTPTFLTAFSAVAATFNNIGPGLDMVGPAGNYAALSYPAKFTLAVGMIMGRLEIFPVLVLFYPRTWRKG